jgi:hypothetical protein
MRLVPLGIAAFALIYSAWFFYDGFVGFPMENVKIQSAEADLQSAKQAGDTATANRALAELRSMTRHNDASMMIQKVLGVIFAIVGVVFVWVALRPAKKSDATIDQR